MAIVSSASISKQCVAEFEGRDSLQNPSYLPEYAFRHFMRDDLVKATIEKYAGSSTVQRQDDLLEYALKNRHVFLTLASSRLVKKIKTLWEAQVKDCHLPVRLEYDETTGRRHMVSLADPVHEATLSSSAFVEGDDEVDDSLWDYSDLRRFVTDQWLFYALIFDRGQFLYQGLSDKRPLPFVQISAGAAGSGNFGKVFRVGLRKEHLIPEDARFEYLREVRKF